MCLLIILKWILYFQTKFYYSVYDEKMGNYLINHYANIN